MVLALVRPHLVEVPQPTRLAQLLLERTLRDQAVVDRVYLCPAYALVITGTEGGRVTMSFKNTADGGRWTVSTTSGYERTAKLATPECFGKRPSLSL